MSSLNFSKPEKNQVAEWYHWVFSLNNGQNPFDPKVGGKFWDTAQTNNSLIWLAGVTATTEPAWKESKISNLTALVASSQGKTVYNDGKGNPVPKLPSAEPRLINIGDDPRDLYCPISTELATATKYPNISDLQKAADEIIDREDVPGKPPYPPAFVEINGQKKANAELLSYRTKDSIDVLTVPSNNVFMLPKQVSKKAAFSDYSVIVKRDALTLTENTLKFGVTGKFFEYTVEYKIKTQTISESV